MSFEEAERAALRYPGFVEHPFPGCFVCGPARDAGDGLRIFPGAVEGRDIAAAPWVPEASLADEDGLVHPAIVWAALDCPSWFGLAAIQPWREGGILLGRLAARILERPRVGERIVTVGWFVGREGRKITCGSALYTDDGTLRALSRATWIALK